MSFLHRIMYGHDYVPGKRSRVIGLGRLFTRKHLCAVCFRSTEDKARHQLGIVEGLK